MSFTGFLRYPSARIATEADSVVTSALKSTTGMVASDGSCICSRRNSVPFTPGGAGVVQALLIKVFAGTASTALVTAYSVGQQIAIAAFSLALGFVALVTIFRFRSFKDVIAPGREAERAAAKVA